MSEVMTAQHWASNAHMLADLFRLMTPPSGPWVDLTYGVGGWWRHPNPAPDHLVRCVGADTESPAAHDMVIDFRATPFEDGTFGLCAFDPPYVLKGGPGVYSPMNQRYGIGVKAPKGLTRKQAVLADITAGLTEAARITRPGGWILAKAGRGIDGGHLVATDDHMTRCGCDLGLEQITSLWLLTTPRSQAHRGPQQSPRSNTSRLTVWRRP